MTHSVSQQKHLKPVLWTRFIAPYQFLCGQSVLPTKKLTIR